eukprot:2587496-Prymnesium_polylepis.2
MPLKKSKLSTVLRRRASADGPVASRAERTSADSHAFVNDVCIGLGIFRPAAGQLTRHGWP